MMSASLCREDEVPWVKPQHSRNAVSRAGKLLITSRDAVERTEARRVLANWRSAHGWPLHVLTQTLRNRCETCLEGRGLVTQRLKRLVSIENKLLRRPHTRATQIQDLGGCRVVLRRIEDVRLLYKVYQERAGGAFSIHHVDDYIAKPKTSGYRSLHLVHRYESDKKPEWRNMRIELQMRTEKQHQWATAVEAASFFLGQDLKAGEAEGEGDKQWLRFFFLMANFTAILEQSNIHPDIGGSLKDFLKELLDLYRALDVDNLLSGWAASFKFLGKYVKAAHRFLVHMDVVKHEVAIFGFAEREEAIAAARYAELEIEYADDPNQHVVLVSAASYKLLQQGYPGFFADTEAFRRSVGLAHQSAADFLSKRQRHGQ
jgi:Region found in RelA / SpoT proteins